MSDELMTLDEVAKYLRVQKQTLYAWRWKNYKFTRGPKSMKVGRHVRYRRSDIDAWLDKHSEDRDV
jgi:predicted DNA-binding transcriptional regulator AlpA|tara:strand:+ start:27 stop:224 length:198 start_codon:yes stop_codon:yes gene_type:complete